MRTIAFVTDNRVMAQGLQAALRERPELDFTCLPIPHSDHVLLDIEAVNASIALVDATDEGQVSQAEKLGREIRDARYPPIKCLLLVNQNSPATQRVVQGRKEGAIDDFVFYESSLEYLLAKLKAM